MAATGNQWDGKGAQAVKLFEKKLRKGEKFKIKEVLREAGYAETTVQQSSKIMKHIRPKLQDTIERMERIREKGLTRLETEIETANADTLVRAIDKMTYNLQLLTGGATQNVAMIIDDQARAKSNQAISQFLNPGDTQ